MDWKIFITTLGTIFLAELGDKTQLAAILMTSKTGRPLSVFTGAIVALSLVTFIGVVLGEGLISVIPQPVLKKVAALAFILIGAWRFWEVITFTRVTPPLRVTGAAGPTGMLPKL